MKYKIEYQDYDPDELPYFEEREMEKERRRRGRRWDEDPSGRAEAVKKPRKKKRHATEDMWP
jgi:hypothetical protein